MSNLASNQVLDFPLDTDSPEIDIIPQFSAMRSAIDELLRALSYVVRDRDECGPAGQCMRRAATLLRGVEELTPPSRPHNRGGLAPWQIRKVASHIDARLDGPIKSEDLAALVRLNPCHFSRVFRNSFGNSPCEYVIRRRIERAQGLMLSTDAPLSQIALDCGLADQSHFSRLFRKVVGETPANWRRARANPPEELCHRGDGRSHNQDFRVNSAHAG